VSHEGTISTVITSSEILEYIAEKGRAFPADIARDLKLARANVHRLLATLQILGFVDRRSDGSCVLTFRLFELGNSVPHSRNLIDPARPAMLSLSQITGHTVNHGILYQNQALFIDKVDVLAYIKLERPIGGSQPLYCTSLGKVLLAFQEESLRETIIASLVMEAHTENTITDSGELRKELEKIRTQGVAFDYQEFTTELNCVAAPIFDGTGTIVSAISVSGAASRFDRKAMQEALSSLSSTAAEITDKFAAVSGTPVVSNRSI
jgi:IclR family transcriptional regulator, KDG regulon repressor